jgi:hypothetical protein
MFSSICWNGNVLEQTAARIKRLSQEAEEVFTTFLITTDTFEESALKLVLSNYQVTSGILDGFDESSNSSYNKIEELINLL